MARKRTVAIVTGIAAATVGMLTVPWTALADQVILDDLIVDGSACVGIDCVNGESFGFDTIRLKENNLRIKAQDTSTSASFPTNDWQLTFNESSNGGLNKFSVDDITGGRIPFTIEAGARTNALYVEDSGDIGIGTNNPATDLEIVTGNTPTMRLRQDGSSGFTAQTWDVAGNEANFFIRDATNGSALPFRIRPGAPSSAIDIDADGNIGVGDSSPDQAIHITRNGANSVRYENSAVGDAWELGITGNGTFKISEINTSGVQFRFSDEGMFLMGAKASPPTTNVALGSMYNDNSGALCWYDGSAWQKVVGAGTCN